MRRSVLLRVSMVAVVAAATLVGAQGAQVAQAGEFARQEKPDFDCDGVPDSVLARPLQNIGNAGFAGAVIVTYGASGRGQDITQATAGVPDSPESNDQFGQSYAWFDRDRDGCDDLVIGAPGESVGHAAGAGSVTLIPGSPAGLATGSTVRYTQDSPGFPDRAEVNDSFGHSLAAGRTQHGQPYLLIGSPLESGPSGTSERHGAIHYLRGATISVIHQDTPGVQGINETGDLLGTKIVASERFFVVHTEAEDVGSVEDAGMVHVFSHTLTGGRPTPIVAFHQNTAGIGGVADVFEHFGQSLSVLSYQPTSGHPIGALVAVGTPSDSVGEVRGAGSVHLVYVSPRGAVRQQLMLTVDTPGVTNIPTEDVRFGWDVVLANLHPASNVARPATLAWAISSFERRGGSDDDGGFVVGGVHAFPPGWQPGDPDLWLPDLLGIDDVSGGRLRSSDTRLFLGNTSSPFADTVFCRSVGWPDLLDGGTLQSELSEVDDCAAG